MLAKGIILSPPFVIIKKSELFPEYILELKNNTTDTFRFATDIKNINVNEFITNEKFTIQNDSVLGNLPSNFFEIDLDFFELKPGETQKIKVKPRNIENLKFDNFYPVVEFEVLSEDQELVSESVVQAKIYSILVLNDFEKEGRVLSESEILQIKKFEVSNSFVSFQQNTFFVEIKNNGTNALEPVGFLEIFNTEGKKLETNLIVNDTLKVLLPNQTQKFFLNWDDGFDFLKPEIGEYKVVLNLKPNYQNSESLQMNSNFYIFPVFQIALILIFSILVIVILRKLFVRKTKKSRRAILYK